MKQNEPVQLPSSRVALLICNFLLNTLSKEQRAELDTWNAASPRHRQYFEDITSRERRKALLSKPRPVDRKLASGVWNNVMERISRSQNPGNSFIPPELMKPSN